MTSAFVLVPFVMGFLGSAHCVTMCGGIAASLSSAIPDAAQADGRPRLALYGLAYNGGRLTSYAIAGAFVGSMGKMASELFLLSSLQVLLRFGAGLLMVGIGLFLLGVLPAFATLERVGGPLWTILRPLTRRIVPVRTARAAWLLGMLWGWLPCGLVYVALALAVAAGSAPLGALTMLAFGAGTLPAMLAAGLFAGPLARWLRQPPVRLGAALLITALGLLNVSTAWAQASFPEAAPKSCCRAHASR